ncbi:UDP-N-acetylmuramoyl-L-alanyl-D-glutamate--2,6-diaminopimelate ligase [Oscillochloris sp. ZM17-4]|uniref:UDP-N-acetylmuramoyl-L-alanyl-D-glutamate--2, 6-diaminopimelate ligase n=1 Tax=Oscillochloris sp. ZM17-4 TaxID=2866714 RepID=UPI001C7361F0|nr:UDP-N-acetylmuramoyl-L-alanyl-D-glutamate--2,6-diaminopimelate ligase [Oscillochloris sp. ZM17-4]MBX0327254.1 UDP-N-acetylmuramoyl-L-alanyl-D-glutamate--2,6-diaminopimelate ligase [Oscillochloris sp. ZM17-4]
MTLTLHDILHGVETTGSPADLDTPILGITYDSRQVRAGWLFVAIRGFHVDGHRYVGQAAAAGAAAVVVDARHWGGDPIDVPLISVADSRVALAPLAANFYQRPATGLRTIGITGTKGKSTTTDLVSQVIEGGGFSTGMISTVDFKVGPRRWPNSTRQSTPEAPEIQGLLREMADAGCAYAVIESTSHALSSRWNRLGGCMFDVAVFLNITHEHLDYHGSFAQYRADKARLFEMLGEGEKGEAWAITNADDPSHRHFLDAAPARARRLTFGVRAEADVRAHEVSAGPGGSALRVTTPWGEARLRLHLPGSFNVSNALAALSVALSQGIPLARAVAALEAVPGIRGRMQPVSLGQPFDVIVDYAHNPDSFEQVLGMLRPLTRGRIIAVFGSAGERDRAKRAVQGEIAGRYADLLVLTDEDPRGEDPAAIIAEIAEGAERAGKRSGDGYLCIPDRAEAIRAAMAAARPGDLVLLLGKGHEGNIIYAGGAIPWDEAESAREALRALGYS